MANSSSHPTFFHLIEPEGPEAKTSDPAAASTRSDGQETITNTMKGANTVEGANIAEEAKTEGASNTQGGRKMPSLADLLSKDSDR